MNSKILCTWLSFLLLFSVGCRKNDGVYKKGETMNKFCQSCGMPMKKDPQGGGTDLDGTKNTDYCSYCYQKGAFTQPDFTAKRMQDFCIVKMKEMGMPKFLGWLFTRNIPKLKRWKNS